LPAVSLMVYLLERQTQLRLPFLFPTKWKIRKGETLRLDASVNPGVWYTIAIKGKEIKLMSIGKNIAALRKAKGYTQEQLGDMLGVSNQAVSKWEGEATAPDIMLLPRLADALGTTLNGLYGLADDTRDLNEKVNEFARSSQELMKELLREQLMPDGIRSMVAKASEDGKLHLKPMYTIGAISYTAGGAAFISEQLSVISADYDLKNGGNIFGKGEIASGMKKLCDGNVRKVLRALYGEAFKDAPREVSGYYTGEYDMFDWEFTIDSTAEACGLSEEETLEAVEKLISLHVVEISGENARTCYIFKKTKAVETAVVFEAIDRLLTRQFGFGCGYLVGHGAYSP